MAPDQWTNNNGHTADINKCVDAMTLLVDIRWQHFSSDLTALISGTNTVLDLATLGLGGAGSFAAKGTSQALAAISAGLGGTKTALSEDVLYKNSITAIVNEMIADRAIVMDTILKREQAGWAEDASTTSPTKTAPTKTPDDSSTSAADSSAADVQPYHSLADAVKDLYDYSMAGSWSHALAKVQAATAANADSCTKQLNNTKKGKTAKPASTKTTHKKGGKTTTTTTTPAAGSDSSSSGCSSNTGSDTTTTEGNTPASEMTPAMLASTAGEEALEAATGAGATTEEAKAAEADARDRVNKNHNTDQSAKSKKHIAVEDALKKNIKNTDKKKSAVDYYRLNHPMSED